MTRRTLCLLFLVAAAAATLGACTIQRGEDRVWRPGDPDPKNAERFAPSYVVPGR